MCFEYGLEPKVVQQLMGHAHYSTTIDIYTQVTKEKFELEVSKFKGVGEIDDFDPNSLLADPPQFANVV